MGCPSGQQLQVECSNGTGSHDHQFHITCDDWCLSHDIFSPYTEVLPFMELDYYIPTMRLNRLGQGALAGVDSSPGIPYGNDTFTNISVSYNQY